MMLCSPRISAGEWLALEGFVAAKDTPPAKIIDKLLKQMIHSLSECQRVELLIARIRLARRGGPNSS